MKKIKIAGFQKNSFVDYPGKIAAVIFLGGCNFACHYCHNNKILSGESNTLDFDDVLQELKNQTGFIDGAVISGGEPTLHPHLRDIIRAVKNLGLLVKLDTNGTNSRILKELDVDFIAMDIKAPLEKYKTVVCAKVDTQEIQKSIDFLKHGTVDYMFRTTLSPYLDESDILKIGELVKGAKCFHLQQFVPNEFSNSQSIVLWQHSKESAKKFEKLLSKYCTKVALRGF
jgi:pyruvate formate lyase activating enzyme